MITVLTSPPLTRPSLTAAAPRRSPRAGDHSVKDAQSKEHVSCMWLTWVYSHHKHQLQFDPTWDACSCI